MMKTYTPPTDKMLSATTASAVGVVIPTYNRRHTLLESLTSVIRQTFQPTKLVIVDDGSTDGTPAAAISWLTDRRVGFEWQVIRESHQSAAHARNVGLAAVDHLPLVAFLDSDDHWPADFLARAVAALQANLHAVAAIADRRFLDADGKLIATDDCRALARDPIPWFFQFGAGVASCTLLRTAAVQAVGGWPSEIGTAEDAALFTEVALAGDWVHLPGDPIEFRWGTAAARKEEHNLSQRHVDSHRRWVNVFENLYERVITARPKTPRGPLHRALGQRWYWAGKQMFALGQAKEARQCFSRAIWWHPTMFRAWRRLAAAARTQSASPHGAPILPPRRAAS